MRGVTDLPPGARCVAHPSRPAVDRCPTCDRPRCGADGPGPRCHVCHGLASAPVTPPPSDAERVVRGALGAYVLALGGGLITAQYVGSPLFEYLAPAVVGIACGAAATAAAGEPRGPVLQRVRVVALVYALVAVALGFRLEGTYGLVEPRLAVLAPYAVAALVCWLWTAPPKRRVRAARGG
jgi:hypothetical protein